MPSNLSSAMYSTAGASAASFKLAAHARVEVARRRRRSCRSRCGSTASAPRCLDRRELGGPRAADALRRRVRRAQLGMLGLERDELAEQRVVLGVADGRRVVDVIALVVLGDLGAQRARRGGAPRRSRGSDRPVRQRSRLAPKSASARGLPGSMPLSRSASAAASTCLRIDASAASSSAPLVVVDELARPGCARGAWPRSSSGRTRAAGPRRAARRARARCRWWRTGAAYRR